MKDRKRQGCGSASALFLESGSASALSSNSGALVLKNGVVEGCEHLQWRRGGSKWKPRGCVDQWSQIRIILMRNRIRIRSHIRINVMRIRNPGKREVKKTAKPIGREARQEQSEGRDEF
jgi:hypothetical protein